MAEKMLIKMQDGGLLNIWEDKDYTPGCPTCDHGSCYVNEVCFTLTTLVVNIKVEKEYRYALSEGDLMKILLPNVAEIQNMTEVEFANWFKTELEKEVSCDEISIDIVSK